MKRDAIDLGTEKISQLFRKMFIPTLLGMLSMSAVTAIDGIFVGHGVGSEGIAAVNICMPILMFFMGIALMAGVGCSVVCSIHLSRKKVKVARLNVTQTIIFVTVIALIPSLLILCYPEQTGILLGSSEYLLPQVKDYLLWFTPCLVFEMWITVSLFIIRLDGAPKLAMWCNIISAVINVVLDWLFVFPLNWGVKGAAFATTISIVVGGVISLIYLLFFARILRLCFIKWSSKSLMLSLRNIGYQCRIGSSALLGEATMAMLMFLGNQVFVRYLGDDGVGAFGIACYYSPFVFMIGNAIAQSAQPIISYNFGVGDMKRVIATRKISVYTAIVCGMAVMLVFFLIPDKLVALFLSVNNKAAQIAIAGFPYFSVGFIPFIVNLTIIGYFQSVEKVKISTLFALLRGFVFLTLCFIFLPKFFGADGIWLSMPLSEIMTLMTIIFFCRKKH